MKLRNSILAYSRIAGIFLFASTAAVSVRADYPSLVLSNSPVAYWRFNETTPSPQPPVVSNVAPALGATGTGYIVDDVTLGQPGIVGNCALFDNAADTVGNCGSRIDVPFQPAINPNAPWTVECWVKPRSVLGPSGDANGLCPVSSMEPYFHGGGNRSGWLFYCGASGKWQMRIGGVNSYVGVVGPVSSSPAQVGVWQHIAGVFDGVTVTLYINGVSVGSATAGPGFKPDGFSSLRIGGSPFNGGLGGTPYTSNLGLYAGNRGWDGWVDEVAVFATALSSNTLFAHYSAATTNNAGYGAQILAANPVGYWHLDETAYTPPDPSTYPIANNSGSLGSAVNGTELLGLEADQAALPYTGFGAGNKACFFSGESGYLSFTNVPTLSNLVSTPITMMAWIKPLAQDFERDIIARGIDPTTGAEVYFRISDLVDWEGTGVDETAYYEVGETPDGATYNSAVFPVPAGDIGNWVFLAGTWDGSNWNLYRNGVLVAQAPDEGGPSQLNSDWSVGSRGDPSPEMGFYFDGYIDEPAIFTNALDGGTIQALYYAANVPPVLTVAPQLPSGPVYSGSGVTFTALAEGNPTLGYQWYKGSTGLAGQNATSLALNNLATTDGGTYSVIVTNAYGAATGSVALVVVTSPPIITVQPTPATRFAGGTFTFSVSASGSLPVSYQWKAGASAIPGATASSYTGTASTSGSYSCTVTNQYGSTNSASIALTVLPDPTGYATVIIGDRPIAYYRLDETNGTGGVAHDYVGGNDGIYNDVIQGVTPGYSEIDPDPCITVGANGATGSYVGISSSAINFSGTNVSFSIEAWANGAAGQVDQSAVIAKGTGNNGGNANEQFCIDVNSGNYRFFVRNPRSAIAEADGNSGPDGAWHHLVGVYDSTAGSLYFYIDGAQSGSAPVPTLGVIVSSAVIGIGSERSGVAPVFDLNYDGSIDEVAIYDYALSSVQVQNHYSAAYGTGLAPFITRQPASLTNYVALPATFSVDAAGSVTPTPLTFQWNKDGVAIPGANSASYTIAALATTDAGSYTLSVTNSVGGTNSTPAKLTVLLPPTNPPAIPGLVLHLPFDNNLTDATGRGNNGTGAGTGGGAISFVSDGQIGDALHYSTITSNNDHTGSGIVTSSSYVTLGDRPDLKFGADIDFTVAYWIRLPVNYILNDLPFFTDAVGSTFGDGFVFAPSYGDPQTSFPNGAPGGWALSIIDGAGAGAGEYGSVNGIPGGGSINDGNWHSLVHVILRGAGKAAVTYLDGAVASFARAGGTTTGAAGDIDNTNGAAIGQDPTGKYPQPGSADIDDLGVWKRALSPLEAAAIYLAGASNHLSFADLPISLTIKRVAGGQVQLTWPVDFAGQPVGVLQSASNAAGPYADVPGATMPYVVTASGVTFYRLRLN